MELMNKKLGNSSKWNVYEWNKFSSSTRKFSFSDVNTAI